MHRLKPVWLLAAASLSLAGCGNDAAAPAAEASPPAAAAVPVAPASTQPAPAASAAEQAAPEAASGAAPKFAAWTVDEKAGGANANCVITIPEGRYSGVCKFNAEGGASFSVEHPNGYPLIGNVESFYVAADTRTVARFEGMDPEQGLQDYGVVNRDSAKDACWSNARAKICPYAN